MASLKSFFSRVSSIVRSVVTILTLDCPQSAEICSKELDQELSRTEWIAMKAHILICKKSRTLRKQLRQFQTILRSLDQVDKIRLSDEAKERIKKKLPEEVSFEEKKPNDQELD